MLLLTLPTAIILCIIGPFLVSKAIKKLRDQRADLNDPAGWYDTGPDLPAEMPVSARLGDCAGLSHGPGALVRPPFHVDRSKPS